MNIRKATLDDACAICGIYNYYVENTTVTFETSPVSEAEIKERMNEVIRSGYSFYVGEVDKKIIGYYYTHRWNNRYAYATTVEESIYWRDVGHWQLIFNSEPKKILYEHSDERYPNIQNVNKIPPAPCKKR
jgi:phosphinothricin acetyltransferase